MAGLGQHLPFRVAWVTGSFAPKAVIHTATRRSGGSMRRIRGRTYCAGCRKASIVCSDANCGVNSYGQGAACVFVNFTARVTE
jgi:hypothetical protein